MKRPFILQHIKFVKKWLANNNIEKPNCNWKTVLLFSQYYIFLKDRYRVATNIYLTDQERNIHSLPNKTVFINFVYVIKLSHNTFIMSCGKNTDYEYFV